MLPTLNFKGYQHFSVGVEETAFWSKPSEQCSVWGWIEICFTNCAFDRSVSGKSDSLYQCSFTMWDDSNNAPTRGVGVWCFAVKFVLTFHQLQLLWPLVVAQPCLMPTALFILRPHLYQKRLYQHCEGISWVKRQQSTICCPDVVWRIDVSTYTRVMFTCTFSNTELPLSGYHQFVG